MADSSGPVRIRVTLPRAAAEYAVRVLNSMGPPRQPVDQAQPIDLVRPNGAHGANWPEFERFVEAAIIGVIIEEWRKRERPDYPNLNDAPPPLPDWVTYYKPLSLAFYDDVP